MKTLAPIARISNPSNKSKIQTLCIKLEILY